MEIVTQAYLCGGEIFYIKCKFQGVIFLANFNNSTLLIYNPKERGVAEIDNRVYRDGTIGTRVTQLIDQANIVNGYTVMHKFYRPIEDDKVELLSATQAVNGDEVIFVDDLNRLVGSYKIVDGVEDTSWTPFS